MNTVDETGSTKFTHEEERGKCIPLLDTLIVRKKDGSVKLLVYHKPTKSGQYLKFESHHPLYNKLGVIKMLLYSKGHAVLVIIKLTKFAVALRFL